jgi:hypothetical protein
VHDKCTYYGSHDQTRQPNEIKTLRPHPDPSAGTSEFEDQENISQINQETTLAGKIGYSSQKESNALQSLQKSFRIPEELIKLHDPVAMNPNSTLTYPSLASRYRNLVALLPPMAISKALVDTYFVEVSWYSAQLDRYYFEAEYAAWQKAYDATCMDNLPRNLQFFPALLFQVLAVAVQFLPSNNLTAKLLRVEDSTARERLSHRYSTAGTEVMAVLKRHNPTLTSVQHDQLKALWLKCSSRGTESWHSVSDAVRQGQDLGLHLQDDVPQGKDVAETLSRLWYDEHKRRIWVALFISDSHMSIILGRPRLINIGDCTVRTPFDCDIPVDPSRAIPGTTNPGGPPSHYSLSLFNYAIGQMFHEMLSLGANKRHTKNYDSVKMLHGKVNTLLSDLPPAVRPLHPDTSWDMRASNIPRQRKQIATVANSFLISLHREHISGHVKSRAAAVSAGIELLEAQAQMFSLLQPHHYRMYGLSCHSIDACMFLSAAVLDREVVVGIDCATLQVIIRTLRRAIDQLQVMAPMSPMAKSGADLLERCFPKVQAKIKDLSGDVTDRSSITLPVDYQDHANGQLSQAWPDSIDYTPLVDGVSSESLEGLGGDRFQPDMFEELVTLDMGQNNYPMFDFDLMEAETSNFDLNSSADYFAEVQVDKQL